MQSRNSKQFFNQTFYNPFYKDQKNKNNQTSSSMDENPNTKY